MSKYFFALLHLTISKFSKKKNHNIFSPSFFLPKVIIIQLDSTPKPNFLIGSRAPTQTPITIPLCRRKFSPAPGVQVYFIHRTYKTLLVRL